MEISNIAVNQEKFLVWWRGLDGKWIPKSAACKFSGITRAGVHNAVVKGRVRKKSWKWRGGESEVIVLNVSDLKRLGTHAIGRPPNKRRKGNLTC